MAVPFPPPCFLCGESRLHVLLVSQRQQDLPVLNCLSYFHACPCVFVCVCVRFAVVFCFLLCCYCCFVVISSVVLLLFYYDPPPHPFFECLQTRVVYSSFL